MSVQDTLTAGALVVDETSLNGNVLQTTSGNNDLTLQAHGTGIVIVNDTFKLGSSTAVTQILDEDNFASNSATALATQQSIKALVDSIDTTLTVKADGNNTSGLTLGNTPDLNIIGTANEITSVLTTNTITIGLTDDVTIPSDLTVTDNLSVNGNAILGTGSPGSNPSITANGRFNSSLIPFTGDDYDLGNSTRQWRNLFIDGTAEIDSLVADTADILSLIHISEPTRPY